MLIKTSTFIRNNGIDPHGQRKSKKQTKENLIFPTSDSEKTAYPKYENCGKVSTHHLQKHCNIFHLITIFNQWYPRILQDFQILFIHGSWHSISTSLKEWKRSFLFTWQSTWWVRVIFTLYLSLELINFDMIVFELFASYNLKSLYFQLFSTFFFLKTEHPNSE